MNEAPIAKQRMQSHLVPLESIPFRVERSPRVQGLRAQMMPVASRVVPFGKFFPAPVWQPERIRPHRRQSRAGHDRRFSPDLDPGARGDKSEKSPSNWDTDWDLARPVGCWRSEPIER